MFGWGSNLYFRLGISGDNTITAPTKLGPDFVIIDGGTNGNSAGIKADGTLWAWGVNTSGACGLGHTTTPVTEITQVGAYIDWVYTSVGYRVMFGIRDNGTIWSTGSASYASGRSTNVNVMTRIGTATNWATVSSRYGTHSLGLRTNGDLWAWGNSNSYGQLGRGNTTASVTPIKIGTAQWNSVVAGNEISIGIKEDGSLWVWGRGGGRLGLGSDVLNKLSPTLLDDGEWLKASAVYNGAVCLKSDHTIWSFGYNNVGELGTGTAGWNATITQIGGTWKNVFSGYQTVFAVDESDRLWGWGRNDYQQLQLGDTTHRTVPTLTNLRYIG